MYTAMKGQNYRIKLLLARNASMDRHTTTPGPYTDFKVSKKYTSYDLDTIIGEENYDKGFT